jgi:hypothetical protein
MSADLSMTTFLLAADCKLIRYSKRKDHLATYWCRTCRVFKRGKKCALDEIIESKPTARKHRP